MDEFNILPIYRNGLDEISNGIDIPVPAFCRKNCRNNERCKDFYKRLCSKAPGIYKCPYGFNACVFLIREEHCIFTCLRVKGQYDKGKIMPKLKQEGRNHKEISEKELETYVQAYQNYWENQRRYEEHADFVNNIFHDLRKYNQQLKIKNDAIYRAAQESKTLKKFWDWSKSIQVLSWFLSFRMNTYDFTYNPSLMEADVMSSYNIYGIFYKVKECLKEKALDKGIKIQLNANRDCRDMQAHDCIEMLPFLLLDNALKYAPEHSIVHVDIVERENIQEVKIRSLGPLLQAGEEKKIFERGFRGENAVAVTKDGMGIGLYTAKYICDLHEIILNVSSGKHPEKVINGISFSEFMVDFLIKL